MAPSAISSRTASGPLYEDPHGLGVAGSRAGDEGVALVLVRGVPRPERCGDTALRPLGRAGGQDVLGDDQDLLDLVAQRSAAVRPAMPEPTTTTSALVVQPAAAAAEQAGRTVIPEAIDLQRRASCQSPRTSAMPGNASAGSEPVPTILLSASTKTTLGAKLLRLGGIHLPVGDQDHHVAGVDERAAAPLMPSTPEPRSPAIV